MGITNGSAAVFRSADNGSSWENISTNLFQFISNSSDDSSFLSAYQDKWLFTNTALSSLLQYHEGAGQWTPISLPRDLQGKAITLLETLDDTLYMGLEGGGVYSTVDLGNWEEVSGNLPKVSVLSMVLDQNSFYVGLEGEGVWKKDRASSSDTSVATSFRPFLQRSTHEIHIFPNPAKDLIHISLPNSKGSFTPLMPLQLLNSQGQRIMTLAPMKEGVNSWDISELPAGLYWLLGGEGNLYFSGAFQKN